MSEPERPSTEAASETPQPASPSQRASPSSEASPSGPVTEETVQPVEEAAFEPLRQAASVPPEAQSAAGTSSRNTIPEAAARPQPPARQDRAAPTAWLPSGLSALLPRLVLPAALLLIPIAAALALQIWLGRTHTAYDGTLLLADGSVDEVTALQWSADGTLYVGTRASSAEGIAADGTVDEIYSANQYGPVQSFHPLPARPPIPVYQDRLNPITDGTIGGFTPINNDLFNIQGGLFALVEANNGSAIVGRAMVTDSGQQFQIPNNEFSANNLLNTNQVQPDPRARQQVQQQLVQEPLVPQQQQQQQQQIRPTDEQLKGGDFQQQAVPVDPTGPSGPTRFRLSLFRDFLGSNPTEVGEIFGIEDVRAVAALPGTDTVIAGDGEGNVFAIDASQQISGASPETYIRGIGQHEAAIVEIAVAADPGNQAVLFATRAEDRTIKVWRGGVSRASQLIPLGDYPYTDVTTPGSRWVRESAANDAGDWSGLFSMSSDGSRILGQDANGIRLLALDPSGAFAWRSPVADGRSAVLAPDGKSFVVVNMERQAVELVAIEPNLVASAPPNFTVAATFTSLLPPFVSFAFDRSGQRFVAVSADGAVSIQNVATPGQAISLSQYRDTGIEAAISPDGSLVAVAESSGQIMIHSTEDGSQLTIINGPQNLGELSFDSSGKRLRASTTDTLRIYTYSLRNLRSTTYGSGLPANGGQDGFIPNGDRFFARNGDVGFRIIDIDGGADAGTLQAATGATAWVSSFDGSRIATLGGRGNISVFRESESTDTNGPMPAMADNALRLSADGHTLVVGDRGGELYLARLDGDPGQTGYRLRRLALPAPALQYEISPDGTSLITAEADGTVSINDLTALLPTVAVPSGSVSLGQTEPAVVDAGTAVADAIEISGHGAPLTAMALSPDGERLATASLDGRLRVTSIAWARLIHSIPLAELPSGPEREKLKPQPLDESPYSLMGIQLKFFRNIRDDDPVGEHYIVVYNASRSLGEAREARTAAAEAGLPDARIYRRRGLFRGVFAFATKEARSEALPRIQEVFSGAYARDDRFWCGDGSNRSSPVPQQDFFDCAAVLTGAEPPSVPAMAN